MISDINIVYGDLVKESKKTRIEVENRISQTGLIEMREFGFSESEIQGVLVFDSLYDKVMDEFTRAEYSLNSTLYGGFYCASLLKPLVVSNVKKGKLTTDFPTSKRYHKYYFNEISKLLCVEFYTDEISSLWVNPIGITKFSPYETHFVFKDENRETRIVYGLFKIRETIIISNFNDGLLLSYAEIGCKSEVLDDSFKYEKYYYDANDSLVEGDMFNCHIFENNSKISIVGDKYIFNKKGKTISSGKFEMMPSYYKMIKEFDY